MRLARAGLIALLALLVAAPGALAAYAPQLEIDIDPHTPASPVAITSRIIQKSGETANKTVKVAFPVGFAAGLKSKVIPCTPEQEQARECAETSKVGSGHAETALANLDGPVYLVRDGSALRLAVHLSGVFGLITQNVYGDILLTGGRVNVVFDNLPTTATTLFTLALEGGDKALSVTPKTCGKGTFQAEFTSHEDEKAADTFDVEIAGCPTTPVVSAVSTSPKVFRALRRFSDTQRHGFSTTLRYTLSEETNGSRIKVQRRVKRRWRRAGSFVAGGAKGANAVKFDGRVRGKALKPGRYRFLVQTTSRSARLSNVGRATFTLRK